MKKSSRTSRRNKEVSVSKNVQQSTVLQTFVSTVSMEEALKNYKIKEVEKHFVKIFDIIFGSNKTWSKDGHFCDTPHRLAKMFVNDIFSNVDKFGCNRALVPEIIQKDYEDSNNISCCDSNDGSNNNGNNKTFDFNLKLFETESGHGGTSTVSIHKLTVKAFCAHHIAPFFGTCTVDYKPGKYIMGLSKFQRFLDLLCGVPTVQEELTSMYCDTLFRVLQPKEITVTMSCVHTCMISRGVKLESATTTTSKTLKQELI